MTMVHFPLTIHFPLTEILADSMYIMAVVKTMLHRFKAIEHVLSEALSKPKCLISCHLQISHTSV